jgi:hypothetical protein
MVLYFLALFAPYFCRTEWLCFPFIADSYLCRTGVFAKMLLTLFCLWLNSALISSLIYWSTRLRVSSYRFTLSFCFNSNCLPASSCYAFLRAWLSSCPPSVSPAIIVSLTSAALNPSKSKKLLAKFSFAIPDAIAVSLALLKFPLTLYAFFNVPIDSMVASLEIEVE